VATDLDVVSAGVLFHAHLEWHAPCSLFAMMNNTHQTAATASKELLGRARENFGRAEASVQRIDQRMTRFARQQPVLAAFSAMAVGFVVGRFVAKRL
jgi:hypothetical protein